jgi:hypothetical protein
MIFIACYNSSCDQPPSEYLLHPASALLPVSLFLFYTGYRMKSLHQRLYHLKKELISQNLVQQTLLQHKFNYTCGHRSEQLFVKHKKFNYMPEKNIKNTTAVQKAKGLTFVYAFVLLTWFVVLFRTCNSANIQV